MRIGNTLLVASLGFAIASSAVATQTVTPVKDAAGTNFTGGPTAWTGTVSGGGQLVFYGRYSSTVANESGLGLKVIYDNAKFTSVTVDNLRTKCMVATPQLIPNGAASLVLFGWADTSIRLTGTTPTGAVGWTGLADPAAPGVVANPGAGQPGGCLNPGSIVTESAAFAPPTNLFRIVATAAAGFTSGTSTISFDASSFSNASGTGAFTQQSLVVTGTVAPPCNLDVDGDGQVLAAKDGILLQRAINPNITAANVVLGINITGPRNTGALIRSYLAGFMAGAGTQANLGATPIDIDQNGSTTAAVEGNAVKRALNPNITAANVILGLAVQAGTTGQLIRTRLNNNCGLNLPTN